MRGSWMRKAVVAVFTTLFMASGIVSAFGVCCQHGGAADGAMMECCRNGGPNHICPFMSKRPRSTGSDEAVKATCAAGHDSGVPASGFGAPPLAVTEAPLPSIASARPVYVTSQAHTLDPHPPSPPPKA